MAASSGTALSSRFVTTRSRARSFVKPEEMRGIKKPVLTREERREKREARRAKQREENVGRAAKMHAARLAWEAEAFLQPPLL